MRRCFSMLVFLQLLLLCSSSHTHAQVYPVQLSTQLVPPYSGYLPDYTDPSSEKLRVILQLRDLSQPQYQVKLKVEIKGNGFTLKTKSFYSPPPITLMSGEPYLLSGVDLAPYLNSNNLDFIGINYSDYERRKALPEGYYRICITAYDYYNPTTQLSNEAYAQAWFTLSDPPFLNLPACNASLKTTNPQNLVFQWTPMHLGSPNGLQGTEYDFALWECRPDTNVNPNQYVLSTRPIFSVTTEQTFFNYGITEQALNTYMKYIWRVKARDKGGRELFKNGGWSQICAFRYGSIQSELGDAITLKLNARAISHRSAWCDWNKNAIYSKYLLHVRKAGTEAWFEYETENGYDKVLNLEPYTRYECRVRGEGNGITGKWSNTAFFTTPSEPQYTCNDNAAPYNTLLTNPLPAIKAIPGLVIQSGQFEVLVTEIASMGAPGWYKGKGFATVLGKKFRVKWDQIFIDDEARQQQGVIEAETKGMDRWLEEWEERLAEDKAIYADGEIDSVFFSGDRVCYLFQGNPNRVCVDKPANANQMVIRDANGNQYHIDLMPPPGKISGPNNYLDYSGDSLDANSNTRIDFLASATQKYGMDTKEHAGFISNYEVIRLKDGKNYFVPNKSIQFMEKDEVLAKVYMNDFNPALVNFKTADGSTLSAAESNTPGIFRVTNIPANAEWVHAFYGNKKTGKLNVIALPELKRKLVLVPVNGSTLNFNIQELNKIFQQACVSWSMEVKPSFSFGLGNDGLEAADAGLMKKYSAEMRALRDAYLKQDSLYDKNAYYLFVVNAFTNPDLKGYMVRGRSLGFISADAGIKEICHELAHGAFALEHTFPKVEKNSSANLMDYSGGTGLVKEQWIYMHSNKFPGNWKDEEEDGSLFFNQRIDLLSLLLDIKQAAKKGTRLTPGKYKAYMSIGETFLNGIKYDYIRTLLPFVEPSGSPKNNIKIAYFKEPNGKERPDIPYVDVNGQVQVYVPANRVDNMKYYLESALENKNMILFVNGYRPVVNFDGSSWSDKNTMEYEDSDDKVHQADLKGYWKGIDAEFSNRIGTKTLVYADGHHSVKTSNHESVSSYLGANMASMAKQEYCNANRGKPEYLIVCATPHNYDVSKAKYLHIPPNIQKANNEGFKYRKTKGMRAGRDLVEKINSGNINFDKSKDTVDVVAHSMGYAYSVGMVEVLKESGIRLGRYYIIAPENACADGAYWDAFTEVWQYGSNLGEPQQDPMYEQDGVAPQCACAGINRSSKKTLKGRIFIPKSVDTKGFLGSHSISNYRWIFTELKPNDPRGGYVKQRK